MKQNHYARNIELSGNWHCPIIGRSTLVVYFKLQCLHVHNLFLSLYNLCTDEDDITNM